jgi:hypothetical protein
MQRLQDVAFTSPMSKFHAVGEYPTPVVHGQHSIARRFAHATEVAADARAYLCGGYSVRSGPHRIGLLVARGRLFQFHLFARRRAYILYAIGTIVHRIVQGAVYWREPSQSILYAYAAMYIAHTTRLYLSYSERILAGLMHELATILKHCILNMSHVD